MELQCSAASPSKKYMTVEVSDPKSNSNTKHRKRLQHPHMVFQHVTKSGPCELISASGWNAELKDIDELDGISQLPITLFYVFLKERNVRIGPHEPLQIFITKIVVYVSMRKVGVIDFPNGYSPHIHVLS